MINEKIELKDIKKIFANYEEKGEYLKKLYVLKNITDRQIPRFKKNIDKEIEDTWDFEISNKIIRELFKKTKKYQVGKDSENGLKIAIEQWNKMELGELEWPFPPRLFDQHVQDINASSKTEEEKDEILKDEIVKFRRIKKINTLRNDFIEYLIVANNENVTPTLKHNRNIDFYINGHPYDQKVSRSVTNKFINDFKDDWKEQAKKHPEIVAKYLYEYQDEARFGAESRLLIVYLDEDISSEDIYRCVKDTNFKEPKHISFEYEHSTGEIITYNVDCYIILLCKKES